MGLFSARKNNLKEAAKLDAEARKQEAEARKAAQRRNAFLNPPPGTSRDRQAERALAADADIDRRIHAANARDARKAADAYRKRWF